MNLETLHEITEKLRNKTVGNPVWNQTKTVYEYSNQSVEVVAILKIVRATQGVHAMEVLCQNGLFVDMGAIWRCVNDSVSEVYFLLENYPEQSGNVEKFTKEFFSKTIDNFLSTEEEPVPNKKILNASMRLLSGKEQDEFVKQTISRVYKTNSGYIHAGYAHIMEMYGGSSKSFNLSGITSREQKMMRMEIVEAAKISVVHSIAFAAQRFDMFDLYEEIKQYC